jgi:hypothetical protein
MIISNAKKISKILNFGKRKTKSWLKVEIKDLQKILL